MSRNCSATSVLDEPTKMKKLLKIIVWTGIGLSGAGALAAIAFERREPLNAVWFVVAALCTYLVAYRFYSAFLAAKVFALDNQRATPAERLEDGRDFVPTNKWVLFGHHFAAIAGPGPLVGPTLAAQFGYLPGTLWLIVGAALGGCVQDFTILFCSIRRDGKSLGQMAREEVSKRGGMIAVIAVLAIMVILLAVVALIIVKALKDSPWGTFTLAMTIPIALLMGVYLRYLRPGRVLEASIGGLALVMFAVFAGQWVNASPSWSRAFTFTGPALAIAIIAYGYAASTLPVWLLLAPRDYLSAFIKVGAIAALAGGVILVRPTIAMPAFTPFVDGNGPVFAGKIFPFCLYHDCLWRDQRIPFAHLLRHYAENDFARRPCKSNRIRSNAGGIICRRDGDGRGMCVATGRVFRDQQPGRNRGENCRRGREDNHFVGIRARSADNGDARAARWRTQLAPSHGRRAVTRCWYGADFQRHHRRRAPPRHLVSLRHHVRGALYPDCPRRRHACGPFYGAGIYRPFLEAAGPLKLDAGNLDFERFDGGSVGIFSVARSDGPARGNQFTLAAFWNRESVARVRGACGGDDDFAEDGPAAMDMGDARADGLARDDHNDRELPENL